MPTIRMCYILIVDSRRKAEGIVHKDNNLDILVTKGIAGETPPEAYVRAKAEQARRERLAGIQQKRDSFADLEELAVFETKQAKIFLGKCNNILKDNLIAGVKIDWASLYNDQPFPPFVYKNPAPRYNRIASEKGVPKKKFLFELFFPSVKKERLKKENEARTAYNLRSEQYEQEKTARRVVHEKEREAYITGQSAYNSKVEELQFNFAGGQPAAVESFARIALNSMEMPDTFNIYFDAVYLPGEKQLVIDCLLPAYYDLPRAVRYQYNKDNTTMAPIVMSDQEYDSFYLALIQQITLAAINTVLNAIPARLVQWAGFNGWVENGGVEDTMETKSCIITCRTARDVFAALELLERPPAECFDKLGGLTASSFTGEETIKPVVYPGMFSQTGDANQDNAKEGLKPPEYRPGEFRVTTAGLIGEVLEQIEKNLLQHTGNKNGTLH